MNDWIDELKQQDDAARKERERKQEWQLRCDRIIKDRALALWQSILSRVRADVVRLAEKFPDDDSKKLKFEERPAMFMLTKGTYPTVCLQVCWQENSGTIQLERFTRRDSNAPGVTTNDLIRFALNAQDDVKMVFGRTDYLAPEDLSRALITSGIG